MVNTTTSTLTNILNTVAPPISAHETLELWLSHPMIGYSGVETVIYRAWMRVLEQTESGEVIIIWSPSAIGDGEGGRDDSNKSDEYGGRSINPVEGWSKAWERSEKEIEAVKSREKNDPQGRARISRTCHVSYTLSLSINQSYWSRTVVRDYLGTRLKILVHSFVDILIVYQMTKLTQTRRPKQPTTQ